MKRDYVNLTWAILNLTMIHYRMPQNRSITLALEGYYEEELPKRAYEIILAAFSGVNVKQEQFRQYTTNQDFSLFLASFHLYQKLYPLFLICEKKNHTQKTPEKQRISKFGSMLGQLAVSVYDNLLNYRKDNQICPWSSQEEFSEIEKNQICNRRGTEMTGFLWTPQ